MPQTQILSKPRKRERTPQCVGELRTPTLAARDGGSEVVLPPQPVQAMGEASTSCLVGKTTTNTLLVSLPIQDLRCGRCGRLLETVGKAVRHFTKAHSAVSVVFECRKCDRSSDNSHSISCHIPKCKGMVETRVDMGGAHCCEHCPERFATSRGLTQHIRHRHIAHYCRKKDGEMTAKKGYRGGWKVEQLGGGKGVKAEQSDGWD